MERPAEERGEGYDERGEGRRGDSVDAAGQGEQGGDGGDTYTGRRGGTIDTQTTTDGDTTTRDTTVTGAEGESGSHTGSVTREGDTVTYRGDSSASTGRSSDAAAAVTKTDDGYVGRGAAVGDRDAAAGTVMRNGDQVYGRSVTTNGDTVNRNTIDCDHGDCTRGTVGTNPAVAGVAAPYFVPYASYPCPGGADMMPSASGDIVYSCGVTPVISATVPLSGAAATGAGESASSLQITSSPVVMYQVSPDVVVYVTSYRPHGIYASDVGGRYYWVPGAAAATPEVADDISAAAGMEQPTANATVVTYAIGGNLIYLTDQAPLRGIYVQPEDQLHAWIPGVTEPTAAQRDAIGTSLAVHRQQGARALADEVGRARADAR